jgi:hypothetical protein
MNKIVQEVELFQLWRKDFLHVPSVDMLLIMQLAPS